MSHSEYALTSHELMAAGSPSPQDIDGADVFLDRDLSLIEFYRRVFDEARAGANPLLERVKFLSIVGAILNEFVTTRYPELTRQLRHVGGSSEAHLKRVETKVAELLAEARSYLREQLTPALAAEGIHLLKCTELEPRERAEVDAYFTESVLPLLMPLGFDAARPFPHIAGRTLAFAVVVRQAGKENFACLQVPDAIPALVPFRPRRSLEIGWGLFAGSRRDRTGFCLARRGHFWNISPRCSLERRSSRSTRSGSSGMPPSLRHCQRGRRFPTRLNRGSVTANSAMWSR